MKLALSQIILVSLLILVGCGGGSSDSSVNACSDGTQIPKHLVGTWAREFNRGGQKIFYEFTSGCQLIYYQIADKGFVERDMDITLAESGYYRIYHEPFMVISSVNETDSVMYLDNWVGQVIVQNESTKEIVFKQDKSMDISHLSYEVDDSGQSLKLGTSDNAFYREN
ncbi:hypothetical protein [Shewanella woodyi]|uniref:Uncharacterized protein n=1 Tax=Shewanella woodyi (strain ATCC 51908 / MS32) TaxID=392500 RepID=B1KIQ5_SHEWM|nr:hypothetical protein [Shewanella woodyi]ACA88551.1 hypothetical protein Swoo_4296 [Shewanella woodyi ATCC 51908]